MVTGAQLGRPVGASGEQTRRRLILATMRCVAEVGYAKATIREIARAAEMTSGSLYHYFPNKSELLTATVREIDQIELPRLRAAAAHSDNVVDRLVAVLDEMHRLMREYPHLAAFERAMRGHAGPKGLRDNIDGIVREAMARGALPAGTDPAAAVDALYALARGLTDRAANLTPDAYAATLDSAKELIRGTLFAPRASRRESTAQRRSRRGL
ncbi:TetR family transcriptional regulator [Mycobacterium sp. 852002-50816_SCH5313054-b]|uniref:TetR/AcrR family transcriptional regulator n=1 Tax=Mycobacterium sp. 852002-50816_SCH5313054-b TaxID=1834092 RepID=UPI000801DAAD|nr:TetR/AcrR family transcriptional regulator [Mycobacterium sp. 852002-50816_SCH5313054-b]OBF54826.1 TetR family transcriptional regulator [Mycobacterium sp. 852002-50816_SCH5313054-b]